MESLITFILILSAIILYCAVTLIVLNWFCDTAQNLIYKYHERKNK